MSRSRSPVRLDLASLRGAYRAETLTPTALVDALAPALEETDALGVWIARAPYDRLRAAAQRIERECDASLPLWGVPFAVKDNIDVAGWPTTAACPEFAYAPGESAPAVERLVAAGALLVGKTNLDQFATGLVGVRSPYGATPNPFDARYVTGGSSSGSAAAVARGLVAFALGTDTAGSGRVPAGFTNTVGLKPSRGVVPTRGVVPACRSLDCVSIFALTVEDAAQVAEVVAGYDAADPYSRADAARVSFRAALPPPAFRFGVPSTMERGVGGAGFIDGESEAAFERAIARLVAQGGTPVTVDFAPLHAAARLLYEGPWVAERLAGLESFVARHPDALLPVTREILQRGHAVRGPAVFRALHELEALRRRVASIWTGVDLLVVPTAPTIPTLAAVAASPIESNARLGRYTNFVNLLDLAALAVPNGFRDGGLPTGITFIGPWGADGRLAALGSAFHRGLGAGGAPVELGATGWPMQDDALESDEAAAPHVHDDELAIAVVGAHLSGQPLNAQLTDRGARLIARTRTAPEYRLYALAGTTPAKPGLVRVAEDGAAIELEVWAMPRAAVGSFVALVPAPLCLGSVELADRTRVTGFLCESHAIAGARDITSCGGWLHFLSASR